MADDTTIRTKIVLEGEAQYRSAMADINRQLKETKTAHAAAAAEYANADAATRTSAAQTEALNRSLELQRERLEMMEAQLKKVEDAYGQNSRQAVELRTKINNARAEMAKTQTQLRSLSDGLEGAAQAGEAMGGGADSAQAAMARIGDAAQGAQDDVRGLADEIGDVVGKKFIEFGLGKEVLSQLANGVKWALGEAINGMAEDAHARALAGDDALFERRSGIKDVIDRSWSGRRSGAQTTDDVAMVDTALGNAGITDVDRVTKLTNMVITMDEVFSQSTQETVNRAKAMVNTFGVSWEDALDLMSKGFRDMSDGGAQMVSAMESYGQAYKQLGYDIDDMYSAIAAAANNEVLGKNSNLNKGVENFISFVTSDSKESKKALKELGAEITDLPGKFQAGGDAAALATQAILKNLQSIGDEAKRNDLGKTIFGEKIWIDSAGKIADVLLAGFNQTVDAAGATSDAMGAELDNLGDNLAGLGERLGQTAESVLQGPASTLNELVKGANGAYDALEEGAKQVEQEIESARQNVGTSLEEMIAARDQAFRQGDIRLVEDLNEKINQALEELPQEVADKYTQMGTDASSALSDTAPDMRAAGETLAGEAVGAATDAQGDMQSAADTLGQSGVTGLEDGLDGMRDASASAADGAVAELFRAVSRFFNAGQAAGKAYERGYKNALDEHSPSRVMRLAAQYSVQGLLEGYDEGESEVAARGAALAEAFHSAYSARGTAYSPAGDAQDAGTGISAGVLAEAVREALSGAGVYLDGQRVGELTAPGVSAGIARSAAATVRGRSARTKGW